MKKSGLTLMEALVAVVGLVLVSAAMVRMVSGIGGYVRRYRVRNQVYTESRICMDTLVGKLQKGSPSSVVICACGNATCSDTCGPSGPTPPPNSRIEFDRPIPLPAGQPASGCRTNFYWFDGTLQWEEHCYGAVAQDLGPNTLATQVTSLMFNADSHDPSVIILSLRIDAPLDSSSSPDSVYTVDIPNRLVRMMGTP
jgi:hypothetical protein